MNTSLTKTEEKKQYHGFAHLITIWVKVDSLQEVLNASLTGTDAIWQQHMEMMGKVLQTGKETNQHSSAFWRT